MQARSEEEINAIIKQHPELAVAREMALKNLR